MKNNLENKNLKSTDNESCRVDCEVINPNQNKIILDLCGGTGSWSKPYADAGYDVRIITLPKYDVKKVYYLWWCLEFIDDNNNKMHVDVRNIFGVLAAPPCPQFSFARTNAKTRRDLIKGMTIVRACLDIIWFLQAHYENQYTKKPYLNFWALENPNGHLKYFLGKPTLEFNPYDYGDDYKKKTHIWGWFKEPAKTPIKCDKPKFDKMKSKDIHPEYFGKLNRQARRAITPKGFATAFYEANK